MRTVLVAGTFDGLHPGHINFFEQARSFGDRLVVIVSLDETVRNIKKRNPVHTDIQRCETIKKLHIVDEVHLGHANDKYHLIEKINPDTIALGYDQTVFIEKLAEELNKRDCKAVIVRTKPYKPSKYKSSKHNYQDHPDLPQTHC